jgi:hypothetical protein
MTMKLTTKKPKTPMDADFAIYIDFKKDIAKPQRVFQTADALIRALQNLDRSLCSTIDSKIIPLMMLEEIESGSLKIWLKNTLEAVDDQSLKELNWKTLVGKYLVKAKYAIIDFVNKGQQNESKDSLLKLSNKIKEIAQETDVRYLPDYKAPNIAELAESIKQISEAKNFLDQQDKLQYIGDDKSLDFDLSIDWTPEKFEDFLTKETVEYPELTMILAIKKPDYLGYSAWELRHGKKKITAKIEDEHWLKDFQDRKKDVRPGDALKCKVKQKLHYGFDNELIAEKYIITKIEEVLENKYRQLDLFDDEKESN